MIDIHAHILAEVDDGAHTLEESAAMIEVAAAAGTTDIVATPHANHQFQFDTELRDRGIEELRAAVGDSVRIHAGCELHLTADNIQDALEHPRKYAINGLNYVLVEFPEISIPNSADEILAQMLQAGINPIVAHPERNGRLQKNVDRLKRWVEQGVLLQLTGQSLLGGFGRMTRVAADDLLGKGLVHFVASDGHDAVHRPPALKQAWDYVEKHYGEEAATCLFVVNPNAALTGGFADSCPVAKRKRWFSF